MEEQSGQAVPMPTVESTTVEPPTAPPAEPSLSPPVATPAPPVAPPAAPLTRRERRLLEEQSSGVDASGGPSTPEVTEPQPIVSSPVEDAALTEILPGPGPRTEAQQPGVPSEPLPPVFGVPLSTPSESSPSTDAQTTQVPPDFSPSRTVGSVSSATSSLILPHAPTVDIAGPLGDTGEIVVTGQIRLPSSLSERGSSPSLVEDRDQDEVMDDYVTGAIAPTAKPMRASQAVSGKGDDTDIVLVRRARWGTATVVTGLAAGVLGLAALGLLVLAMLTDVVG